MKKIGIITFHRAINYGAVLQMYALYTLLTKKNNDVKIIDYDNSGIKSEYSIISKNKTIKANMKDILKNVLFYGKITRRKRKFATFLKDNFKFTKYCCNEDSLKELDGKFDFCITGSDQVWNPNITNGIDNAYFLGFCHKTKKISYAASFGSLNVLKNNFDNFIMKMNSLDKVSVRENGIAEYINNNSNLEVTATLDPTLLLSQQDWINVLSKKYNNKKKYVFLYSVGDKKEAQKELCYKVAKIISEKEKLDIVDYSLINSKGMINSYDDDPFEFLSAINNAEYVVASSFHGAIFSIIFNKKMWIAANNNTGIRVYNLMDKFGLSNRIINQDFKDEDLIKDIDFKKINNKLDCERKKSIEWLFDSLK